MMSQDADTEQAAAQQPENAQESKSVIKKVFYYAGMCAAVALFCAGIYGTINTVYSIKNKEALKLAKQLNIKAEDVLKKPGDYIKKPVLWKFKYIDENGLGITQEGGVNVDVEFGKIGRHGTFLLNEKGERSGTVLGIIESVNGKYVSLRALDTY